MQGQSMATLRTTGISRLQARPFALASAISRLAARPENAGTPCRLPPDAWALGSSGCGLLGAYTPPDLLHRDL